MSLKTKLYIGGALALVLVGAYAGRRYSQAGGASGIAFNFAGTLWDSAVSAAASAGGAVLDAMPSAQVTAVVDSNKGAVNMANPVQDTGTLLYGSYLMGLGN